MTQATAESDSTSSKARGRPGRQRLSREVVEKAAITVARKDGFGSLSIRNVARALGVAPMALYTHVKNKDELAAHVADALIGEIDTRTQPVGTWQDQVRSMLRAHRAIILEHSDAVPYIAAAVANPGPGVTKFNSAVMTVLASAGFSEENADELYFTLITFNYGSAVTAPASRKGSDRLLMYNDGLGAILRAYESRMSRPALGKVLSMADRLRFGRR